MVRYFGALAFIGLASAALEPRELVHRTSSQPVYVHHRDIRSDTTTEPCKLLSEVYVAADFPKNQAKTVDVPPSVGIACLKSVPVDKERDLELLEYLVPYVSFQSTLETLVDPPEEYLLPGVDVWGGLDAMRQKLKDDGYENQYDVMNDLRSIFAQASDGHFDYPPALLDTLVFIRKDLNLVSLSGNGIWLPHVYSADDVARGNRGELDYRPSAILTIDGIDVAEFLEQDAVFNTQNYQDPDAQYNNAFSSTPGQAAGKASRVPGTAFEIPDNYTITFGNGTSKVVHNQISFKPNMDFTNVTSGEDFHKVFEVPPEDIDDEEEELQTTKIGSSTLLPRKKSDRLPGYPKPVVKHSADSISGYFLEAEGYEDVAVLVIPSFLPIGLDLNDLRNLNITEFIVEARHVITEFFEAAKADNRTKLVLDFSANGGGSTLLADEVYGLLFPDADFNLYDRYPANEAIAAAVEADYDTFLGSLIGPNYPLAPGKKVLDRGKKFFGPYTAGGGQNVTAPFINDMDEPFAIDLYVNNHEPEGIPTAIEEAFFTPENMLIVTDGSCGSACTILTGLLTRNQGIRTLALGGRPQHLPMQAMGGVKGSVLHTNGDIRTAYTQFYSFVSENETAVSILEDASAALPDITQQAPLLPLIKGASSGSVNGRNAYTVDDLNGYPVHFKYEAANCRLFYTQKMFADPGETWRRAAGVAWGGEKCVKGSTANWDQTISDATLAYSDKVRSKAAGIPGPGALKK